MREPSRENCQLRHKEKPAAIRPPENIAVYWVVVTIPDDDRRPISVMESSDMPLRLLTTNLFSIALAPFVCILLAAPLIAQEKPDLAKLAAQLKDKDAAVRREAVEALSQLSEQAGVDLLISALSDDNQDVRSAATLALGQAGSAKGV